MAGADVDDEIDRLLAAPPAAFVEERRRSSDALKAAGRRDDAKTIAKLNKPSVPVWVLNQLARTEKELLLRLGSLSDELREVPAAAAAAGYAQIVAEHRDVLRSLRAAAERILVQSGHDATPALLERVVHSLRAGMADEQTRAVIERGRLLREVGEVDFTTMVGAATAAARADDASKRGGRAPTAATTPAGGEPKSPSSPQARSREQERAAAATERERTRARAAAEREVERLRALSASARKRVAEEERALESARRVLDAASQALAKARQTLDEKEARTETARGEAATSAAALESAETAARKLAAP